MKKKNKYRIKKKELVYKKEEVKMKIIKISKE